MPFRAPAAVRGAAVNAVAARVDAGTGPGKLRIYSGSQPATGGDTATGTLLVEFTLADPAYATADVSGVAVLDADPDISATAAATGTAGWGRVVDSDGNVVFDGTCGTSAGAGVQFVLSSLSITSGQPVNLTSGSLGVTVA